MGFRPGPVSGVAIGLATAGSVLLVSGLKNATVSDTVRAILKGQKIPSQPSRLDAARGEVSSLLPKQKGTPGSGGGESDHDVPGELADKIVSEARAQIGKPYSWAADGPDKFDCSGLVSYVLRRVGALPAGKRLVTGQFYVWSGATTVSRPPRAGDLICWTGHIGIATSATRMVHAPTFGQKVQESNIWWTGSPLVRRVKGV